VCGGKHNRVPLSNCGREKHKCKGGVQLALGGSSHAIRRQWGVDRLTAAQADSALGTNHLLILLSGINHLLIYNQMNSSAQSGSFGQASEALQGYLHCVCAWSSVGNSKALPVSPPCLHTAAP